MLDAAPTCRHNVTTFLQALPALQRYPTMKAPSILILCLLWCSLGLQATSLGQTPTLQLKKGDHIAFIGNTLADRMQHTGWLDTYLHALHPDYDLSMRNLGYPGDELTTRIREREFRIGGQLADQGRSQCHLLFLWLQRSPAWPKWLREISTRPCHHHRCDASSVLQRPRGSTPRLLLADCPRKPQQPKSSRWFCQQCQSLDLFSSHERRLCFQESHLRRSL